MLGLLLLELLLGGRTGAWAMLLVVIIVHVLLLISIIRVRRIRRVELEILSTKALNSLALTWFDLDTRIKTIRCIGYKLLPKVGVIQIDIGSYTITSMS